MHKIKILKSGQDPKGCTVRERERERERERRERRERERMYLLMIKLAALLWVVSDQFPAVMSQFSEAPIALLLLMHCEYF
jgi:di/tricarboxylate transporter